MKTLKNVIELSITPLLYLVTITLIWRVQTFSSGTACIIIELFLFFCSGFSILMYLSGSNGVWSSYFWNTNSRKFNPLVVRLSLSKCAVINPRDSWAGGGWQSVLAQWMEAKYLEIQCLSVRKELWFIFPDGFCCLGLTNSLPLGPDLPICQRWSCLAQMVEGTSHQFLDPFALVLLQVWHVLWAGANSTVHDHWALDWVLRYIQAVPSLTAYVGELGMEVKKDCTVRAWACKVSD